MSDPAKIVGEVTAVLSLIRESGAEPPAAVTEARDAYIAARRATTSIPDRRTLGTLALDDSPAKARRAYLDGLAAREVHAATQEETARRAYAAVGREAAGIVATVLSAPALADAVAEIASTAPRTPPGIVYFPREGSDEGLVSAAARLRAAEGILVNTAQRLSAHRILAAPFASDPDRVAFLWIDPSAVESAVDAKALDRALRGVRPGTIDAPIGALGPDGLITHDQAAYGIRSAIAAAIPTVRFSLAKTRDEFEDRVSAFEAAMFAARRKPRPGLAQGEPAVSWG